MAVHFVTFSAGSHEYRVAGHRLVQQAKEFPGIDVAQYFCEDDLGADYYKDFENFPRRFPKGFGLWSWKPYIVKKYFEKIPIGDILIYLDAGCELNVYGVQRFNEYINIAKAYGGLFFQLPYLQSEWSKKSDLLRLEGNGANQVVGGVFVLHKEQATSDLVSRWYDLCSYEDGLLLKDPLPSEEQDNNFIAHRNDQSCLTKALEGSNFRIIENDETWNKNLRKMKDKPFCALRNRTKRSKLYKVHPFPWNISTYLKMLWSRYLKYNL